MTLFQIQIACIATWFVIFWAIVALGIINHFDPDTPKTSIVGTLALAVSAPTLFVVAVVMMANFLFAKAMEKKLVEGDASSICKLATIQGKYLTCSGE